MPVPGDNPYPDWPGFASPHFTQVPDELFDLWLPHLSGAELKVLLYLMRRTFGWKKDADAVSLAQICRGIRRRDGTPLDAGTGLAVSTAVAAVKGLEAKRLIIAARAQQPDGEHATTVYQVRLRGSAEIAGPFSENRSTPSPISGAPVLRKSEIQETPVQDTIQERIAPRIVGLSADEIQARRVADPGYGRAHPPVG